MMVRRFAFAGVTAMLALGSAIAAHAATPKQAESWACNPSGTLTVLWHPHGHGPIESLGFPAWTAPHVEFYKGARPGLDTYLIYAGSRGQGPIPAFTSNPYCLPADKTTPFLQPRALKQLDGEAFLTCKFSRKGRFLATKLGAGTYRIQAVLGTRVIVDALVKPRGSLVRYAATSCKQAPVPE